ncbi:hypothetical protein [Leptospira sp. GIMC2001]|uniref:hypothetical protein n=1 Tax=Leptospira sp. GIMC2001 TaxID=1513297 RepID=UPI00234BF68D|nr:hypothetical protein [Leptospira sp. GIMC2001]WCL51454.1 hypothetical protein O4O04_20270 [Leptospira sp. GIMC2001]
MLQEIEDRNQVTNLERLVGKFSRPSLLRKRTKLIIKLLNTIKDLKVRNYIQKNDLERYANDREYLKNQITERDLMLADCYETLTSNKFELDKLKSEIKQSGRILNIAV